MSISNIPDCARRWPCGRTVAHMNSSAIIWTLAISDDLAGINSPWADVVAQADPQRIRTVCVVVGEHINSFSMGGVFTAAPTGRLPLDIGRGLYAVMSPELAFDEDAEWEERYCAQEWPWKHVEDRETLGLRKLMSKLEEICRGPLQQRYGSVWFGFNDEY
ncbi:hypothetical protein SISNIDRAFT_65416 [Sistotremastrum niveocremeum HHB9708]|uniref:Uncharacterized protein n=1 Tax=Sistotremastrum niveocremeum HHB9708 TaxID=1314777 RepID=A0A164UYM2_9AGAM|nr:hypothetical protein SISNIDRAFT_65416 [Sistotremastrum niveocremeum HHB9708]